MKKLLLLLLAAITFAACEGPEGADGAPGRDGEGVKWENLIYEIKASDWKRYGEPGELESYFYATVNAPQITDDVFDVGTVISYIELAPDLKNGLPYIRHMGEAGSDKDFLYTKTFDFDFNPGYVTFYLTISDFMTQDMPEKEKFHVVLMW